MALTSPNSDSLSAPNSADQHHDGINGPGPAAPAGARPDGSHASPDTAAGASPHAASDEQKPDPFAVSDSEPVPSFEAMGLQELLLRGVYACGFEEPSPIQQRAIVPAIRGHDVIAQAHSGTGKTASFGISLLQSIDLSRRETQALVLAPTRELATQSYDAVIDLGDYLGVSCLACIGGTSVGDDMARLAEGVHVVVGTPGRVMDMAQRGALDLRNITHFVLDEADEMLSKGFADQIYDIFRLLPSSVQVLLYSATMPPDALALSSKFMRDPVRILVKEEALTLDGIKQFYVDVEREDWKLDTLCDLYDTISIAKAVIFCRSRRQAEWLSEALTERDFTVSALHGEMPQRERSIVMREFRSGASRVLVTTDLVARGINVQQVSVVINFDLPRSRETYIHRIGRSGRMGRKGVAINFVTQADAHQLRDLEAFYHTQIKPMPLDVADLI